MLGQSQWVIGHFLERLLSHWSKHQAARGVMVVKWTPEGVTSDVRGPGHLPAGRPARR